MVSGTADVHKAVTELKENLIQKVDGLPSGLEGKACESNVMGLSGAEVISEKQSNGPNAVKPKSSWTRFNRMDFGLGDLQKVLLPSNGKRPLPANFDGNLNIKGEEGRTKRGKVENEEASVFERSVGWMTTLAGSNETIMLKLLRAWESLDKSKPLQTCEGTSSHCVFSYGNTSG